MTLDVVTVIYGAGLLGGGMVVGILSGKRLAGRVTRDAALAKQGYESLARSLSQNTGPSREEARIRQELAYAKTSLERMTDRAVRAERFYADLERINTEQSRYMQDVGRLAEEACDMLIEYDKDLNSELPPGEVETVVGNQTLYRDARRRAYTYLKAREDWLEALKQKVTEAPIIPAAGHDHDGTDSAPVSIPRPIMNPFPGTPRAHGTWADDKGPDTNEQNDD